MRHCFWVFYDKLVRFHARALALLGVLVLSCLGLSGLGVHAQNASMNGSCTGDLFSHLAQSYSPQQIWICRLNNQEMFCPTRKKDLVCAKLYVNQGKDLLAKAKLGVLGGFPAARRLTVKWPKLSEEALAAYLSAMNWNRPVKLGPSFKFQTGSSGTLHLSHQAFQAKCFQAIVRSAYKLQMSFPEYNFQIDGGISNCQALESGVARLVSLRNKVVLQLAPLVATLKNVYLTTQTKFYSSPLGQNELYINANKPGEVERQILNIKGSSPTLSKLARSGSRL